MPDTRPAATARSVFGTRASALAAWLISVVVIWPILWLLVSIACLFCVEAVLTTLYPKLDGATVGMMISFVYLPWVCLATAIVTGIACYKTCRYVTAPWRDLKPLAFENGTVMSVVIALVAAFAFWACLAALLAVP